MKLNETDRKRIFRCQTCGRLCGYMTQQECAGHYQRYAYRVTPFEWIKIKLGIIK